MEIWGRLKPEPARLRAAVRARNHRQLAAITNRLAAALAALAGPSRGARPARARDDGTSLAAFGSKYLKLATAAAEFGIHSKTLERWLEEECPEALFKRRRMTLVIREPYEAWKARPHLRRASNGDA